ncbi:MAG: transmembrane repetitive protein, partial [Pseudoxanthomonas sp.]
MTNAADIIDYLARRKPAPVLERRTRMPHGWGLWLRARPEKDGRLDRDLQQGIAAHLAARQPRPPDKASPPMSAPAAARALLWQHWEPPPRE